jgi:hypothetical protein
VIDYDAARQRLLDAALGQGAELADARMEGNFQGKKHGWMRFRMEADRLPALLAAVQGVGKLYSQHLTSAEHISEYEELQRRIGRLQEHQQRLASVLASPRRLRGSDILYLQERLFRAGVDEGLLRQRRLDLERSARTGTLVVELFEPEPRRAMDLGNYYAGAALRARAALFRIVARWLAVGAYIVAFAPLWLPALVMARVIWRRQRRPGAVLAR